MNGRINVLGAGHGYECACGSEGVKMGVVGAFAVCINTLCYQCVRKEERAG